MNEQKRTLAESMAIAVLRGDWTAACALADLLAENQAKGATVVPSIHSMDAKGLRAVFTTYPSLGADVMVDWIHLQRDWNDWVNRGKPLVMVGMQMELYSLPGLPIPDWVFSERTAGIGAEVER